MFLLHCRVNPPPPLVHILLPIIKLIGKLIPVGLTGVRPHLPCRVNVIPKSRSAITPLEHTALRHSKQVVSHACRPVELYHKLAFVSSQSRTWRSHTHQSPANWTLVGDTGSVIKANKIYHLRNCILWALITAQLVTIKDLPNYCRSEGCFFCISVFFLFYAIPSF